MNRVPRLTDRLPPVPPDPLDPETQLRHLLRVAESVSHDANKAWAEVWSELKVCATGGGLITEEAKKGFQPACGWDEFLERFWLIKFYLDSIQRVCSGEH